MSRTYLDACAIIYLIEGARPVRQLVTATLSQCHAKALITARLLRLECRVLPFKNNDTALLSTYDSFFSAAGMSIGELTPDVIERATEIRATYGFKTPDALHLVSAIEGKSDVFITGDSKLAKCTQIRVEVV